MRDVLNLCQPHESVASGWCPALHVCGVAMVCFAKASPHGGAVSASGGVAQAVWATGFCPARLLLMAYIYRLTILVGLVVMSIHTYACIPCVNTLYTTCLYILQGLKWSSSVPGPSRGCEWFVCVFAARFALHLAEVPVIVTVFCTSTLCMQLQHCLCYTAVRSYGVHMCSVRAGPHTQQPCTHGLEQGFVQSARHPVCLRYRIVVVPCRCRSTGANCPTKRQHTQARC
jgi:hypothetical protein